MECDCTFKSKNRCCCNICILKLDFHKDRIVARLLYNMMLCTNHTTFVQIPFPMNNVKFKIAYSTFLYLCTSLLVLRKIKKSRVNAKRKQRFWVRELMRRRTQRGAFSINVIPLPLFDREHFFRFLRMSPEERFADLLSRVTPLIQKKECPSRKTNFGSRCFHMPKNVRLLYNNRPTFVPCCLSVYNQSTVEQHFSMM